MAIKIDKNSRTYNEVMANVLRREAEFNAQRERNKAEGIFETAQYSAQEAQYRNRLAAIASPRKWASGAVQIAKSAVESTRKAFYTIPRGAAFANQSRKMYDLSTNAQVKAYQTDDEEERKRLLQEAENYRKYAQTVMQNKAIQNLEDIGNLDLSTREGRLRVAAISAGAGLEVGGFLVGGGAGATGKAAVGAKGATTAAATKTTKLQKAVALSLGIGDIAETTVKGVKGSGFIRQGIVSGVAQAPLQGALETVITPEEDSLRDNILYSGSAGVALNLGFGFVGYTGAEAVKGIQKSGVFSRIKPKDTKVSQPEVLGLPAGRPEVLGLPAGRPEMGIRGEGFIMFPSDTAQPIKSPVVDFTETVRAENILVPDDVDNILEARNTVDTLAMLDGKVVAGKAINIDENNPDYQRIKRDKITPLVEKINNKKVRPDLDYDDFVGKKVSYVSNQGVELTGTATPDGLQLDNGKVIPLDEKLKTAVIKGFDVKEEAPTPRTDAEIRDLYTKNVKDLKDDEIEVVFNKLKADYGTEKITPVLTKYNLNELSKMTPQKIEAELQADPIRPVPVDEVAPVEVDIEAETIRKSLDENAINLINQIKSKVSNFDENKVIKLAKKIADFDKQKTITPAYISEAFDFTQPNDVNTAKLDFVFSDQSTWVKNFSGNPLYNRRKDVGFTENLDKSLPTAYKKATKKIAELGREQQKSLQRWIRRFYDEEKLNSYQLNNIALLIDDAKKLAKNNKITDEELFLAGKKYQDLVNKVAVDEVAPTQPAVQKIPAEVEKFINKVITNSKDKFRTADNFEGIISGYTKFVEMGKIPSSFKEPEVLAEILKKSDGLPNESRILYAIAAKPNAFKETRLAALSKYEKMGLASDEAIESIRKKITQPQDNKIPAEVKGKVFFQDLDKVSFQDLDEVKIKLPTGEKTYKLQYKATDTQKELISKLEKEKNVLFELKFKETEKLHSIDFAAIEKIKQKIKNLKNKDTSSEWLEYKKLSDKLNSIAEDSTITDAEISDLADKMSAAYNKAIDKPKYNVLYKQIDKIEEEYDQAIKQKINQEKKLKKLAKQYYDTNPPSSKEETSINNPNPINFDDWYRKYYTFDREPADAYPLKFNEKDFNSIQVRQAINANKIPAEKVEPTAISKNVKKFKETETVVRKHFTEKEVNGDFIEAVSKPEGQEALDKNLDTITEFTKDPNNTTPDKQVLNSYFNLFVPKEEKRFILEQIKEEQNITDDLKAEEWMADDFIRFARETQEGSQQERSDALTEYFEYFKTKMDMLGYKKNSVKELNNELKGQKKAELEEVSGAEVETPTELNETEIQSILDEASNTDTEPVELGELEVEVRAIQNELEQAGIQPVPEKISATPNLDKLDEAIDTGVPPEMDVTEKAHKEYIDNTGTKEDVGRAARPQKDSRFFKRATESLGIEDEKLKYTPAKEAEAEAYAKKLFDEDIDGMKKIVYEGFSTGDEFYDGKIMDYYATKMFEEGNIEEGLKALRQFSSELTEAGKKVRSARGSGIFDIKTVMQDVQNNKRARVENQLKKEVAQTTKDLTDIDMNVDRIAKAIDDLTCK